MSHAMFVLGSAALLALMAPAQAAETGRVGQPPSVNKPVERTAAPPVTGNQYVRQPIVKEPQAESPELTQVRAELAQVKTQIAQLSRQRDSAGGLGKAQAQALQQATDRKAKLEQRLAALLQQQTDSQQTLIDNLK